MCLVQFPLRAARLTAASRHSRHSTRKSVPSFSLPASFKKFLHLSCIDNDPTFANSLVPSSARHCSALHSPQEHLFFAKTRDGLRAFNGADLSRARLARVHRRPLTGSTRVRTPVLKLGGLSGEKWRRNLFGPTNTESKSWCPFWNGLCNRIRITSGSLFQYNMSLGAWHAED